MTFIFDDAKRMTLSMTPTGFYYLTLSCTVLPPCKSILPGNLDVRLIRLQSVHSLLLCRSNMPHDISINIKYYTKKNDKWNRPHQRVVNQVLSLQLGGVGEVDIDLS